MSTISTHHLLLLVFIEVTFVLCTAYSMLKLVNCCPYFIRYFIQQTNCKLIKLNCIYLGVKC
jgi:hypothetical protein